MKKCYVSPLFAEFEANIEDVLFGSNEDNGSDDKFTEGGDKEDSKPEF